MKKIFSFTFIIIGVFIGLYILLWMYVGISFLFLGTLVYPWDFFKNEKIDYRTYYTQESEIQFIGAVMNGERENIKNSILAGTSPNAVGKDEITPLGIALKEQNQEMVNFLLQSGADPNFITPLGAVPAFEAIKLENPHFLEMLISYGLNPNITEDGDPIIFSAIRLGKWKQFQALLERGVDVNIKNKNNTTLVLQLLLKSEYDPAYQYAKDLIIEGADFTTPDNAGRTVLQVLKDDLQSAPCSTHAENPACRQRAEILKIVTEKSIPVTPVS